MESNISKLLQLEFNCRTSENKKELYYKIVNETRNLVDYSQGVLFNLSLNKKYKVVAISDISVVDSTSPYVQWIEDVVKDLQKNPKSKDTFILDAKLDLKEINYKALGDFASSNILYLYEIFGNHGFYRFFL